MSDSVRLGSSAISAINVGSSAAASAYVGAAQVFGGGGGGGSDNVLQLDSENLQLAGEDLTLGA